jgi:tetratricopeptide (TPR) repeat protein
MISRKNTLFSIYLIVLAGLAIFFIARHYAAKPDTNAPGSGTTTATDLQISKTENELNNNPDRISTYIQLAYLYNQKVRETADVAYYKKIAEVLNQAETINPNEPDIFAARATVELGRHNFREALLLVSKAIGLNPKRSLYYGIAADAFIEIGEYEQAQDALQAMVDLRPDSSAYARIAYIRELYGDIEGAVEAMQTAIDFGSPFPENIAWNYVELGKLYARHDARLAEQAFQTALGAVPNFAPALQGLGKLAFFAGDQEKAKQLFQQAFDVLPIAQYAADVGDVYASQGDTVKASQQYALANIAFDTSASSGINTDLEIAGFLADHDLDLATALSKAQAAYAVRPGIYAANTLAWAYYKNNDLINAEKYSKEALRLGEHDPLIVYHAGMIALKKGDQPLAKKYFETSLSLYPNFSIKHSGEVREMLKSL